MRGVLAVPSCPSSSPLYYMYRDLAITEEDHEWLSSRALRYDLTVIPPLTLCGEFVKTKGHFHPASPEGPAYPELYQVLAGQAHYLLQASEVADCVLVDAGPGDVVVVPPGFGHVTINPAGDELAMVNIVSSAFESNYSPFEEMHGAAWFEYAGEGWVPNPAYEKSPPLRTLSPAEVSGPAIPQGRPIYDLVGDEEALAFLSNPSLGVYGL